MNKMPRCSFTSVLSLSLSLIFQSAFSQTDHILHCIVDDIMTGERVVGAGIYFPNDKKGLATNSSGEASIWLKSGSHLFLVSSLGYEPLRDSVNLTTDSLITIHIRATASTLQEVVISGQSDAVHTGNLGENILNLNTLKRIPALLGESDVVRGLLLMPGVSTVGEGATGFNVRGSGVDQTLVTVDDAPVFNTSHLFGFLTAFSSDAVANAQLYKGSIPASYGGRAAAVLDIGLRQGNQNQFEGSAGLGLMAAHATIEGPIIQKKTSFLLSIRKSYSDWLLRTTSNDLLKNSNASFYDGILKISQTLNDKNRLSFTSYTSHDSFKFPGDTTYAWSTQNFSLQWAYNLSPSFFISTALIDSRYGYKVDGQERTNEFDWSACIHYQEIRTDEDYTFNRTNKATFGAAFEHYDNPLGKIVPSNGSNILAMSLPKEHAFIESIYYSHEIDLTSNLLLRCGLRYSDYQLTGPGVVNNYEDNVPRSEETFKNEETYAAGEVIQSYTAFEPRASLRLLIGSISSLKLGFDQTAQYIQIVSNTSAVAPVDIWKMSDPYLKPPVEQQLSGGYFANLHDGLSLSGELYVKSMQHEVDYKDGADLLLNDRLEADLLQGRGRAYGMEWMIERNKGKLTGWISYTLSRTERKVWGAFPEQTVNKGNYYPANYDRTHNISATANIQLRTNLSVGFNFVFYTGRPVTYPTSSYAYGNVRVISFEERNNARTPSYHRLDFSLTLNSKPHPIRKWTSSWVFSLYNVYAHRNPYSIFFRSKYLVIAQAYKLSVIGTIIPSLTYTVNF